MEKVRTIVSKISNSYLLTDEFRELIDIANKTGLNKKLLCRLVKYVATRWLTNYSMIERFLLLQTEITKIMMNNKKIFNNIMLTKIDIYVLTIISKFLSAINAVSKEMEGEKYPTLSHSTAMYTSMIQSTNIFFHNQTLNIPKEYEKQFDTAIHKFISKMSNYYSKSSLLTYCGMVMDP